MCADFDKFAQDNHIKSGILRDWIKKKDIMAVAFVLNVIAENIKSSSIHSSSKIKMEEPDIDDMECVIGIRISNTVPNK